MSVTVSRATPDDLDELVELFEAYRAFYEKPADPDGAREFLSRRMSAGESVVFIARDADGRVLGFTQLYPLFSSTRMKPMWLLNDLFVTADMRGQGVGAALLERAREHARGSGACELMLETANDNPARRLYERSGYEHVTGYAFYKLEL